MVTVLEHPANNNIGVTSWASHKPQLIDVPNSGDLSPVENLVSSTNSFSGSNSDYSDLNYALNRGDLYPIWQSSTPPSLDGNIPVAERVNHAPPPPPAILPEGIAPQPTEVTPDNVIDLNRERERRHRTSAPTANTMMAQAHAPLVDGSTSSLVPTKTAGKAQVNREQMGKLARRRRRRKLNVNVPRLVIVGAGAIAVTSAGVFLTKTTWNWLETAFNSSTPNPQSGNGAASIYLHPQTLRMGTNPQKNPSHHRSRDY